jgi:hypothetical protein
MGLHGNQTSNPISTRLGRRGSSPDGNETIGARQVHAEAVAEVEATIGGIYTQDDMESWRGAFREFRYVLLNAIKNGAVFNNDYNSGNPSATVHMPTHILPPLLFLFNLPHINKLLIHLSTKREVGPVRLVSLLPSSQFRRVVVAPRNAKGWKFKSLQPPNVSALAKLLKLLPNPKFPHCHYKMWL